MKSSVREKREPRPRRSDFNGEWIIEAYFAVMTIVILAVAVGVGVFAVRYVIPACISESLRSSRIYLNSK